MKDGHMAKTEDSKSEAGETEDAGEDQLRRGLVGRWYRSVEEEDDEDTIVYRSADFEFPPSRMPRESIEFDAEGVAGVGSPGPADALETTSGSWEVKDDVLNIDSPQKSGEFEVKHARDGLLILQTKRRKGSSDGNEEE